MVAMEAMRFFWSVIEAVMDAIMVQFTEDLVAGILDFLGVGSQG